MISSQLGRMMLDNMGSSADEMSFDYSMGSDPIDELLEDVATRSGWPATLESGPRGKPDQPWATNHLWRGLQPRIPLAAGIRPLVTYVTDGIDSAMALGEGHRRVRIRLTDEFPDRGPSASGNLRTRNRRS